MKALYLIIQCELTYYCVKSAVSLEQGGRGAERSLPAAFVHGCPGEKVPGGCCPTGPLPLSPPYRGAKATNLCRFANLRSDSEASPGRLLQPRLPSPGAATHPGDPSAVPCPPPDTSIAPLRQLPKPLLNPGALLPPPSSSSQSAMWTAQLDF